MDWTNGLKFKKDGIMIHPLLDGLLFQLLGRQAELQKY